MKFHRNILEYSQYQSRLEYTRLIADKIRVEVDYDEILTTDNIKLVKINDTDLFNESFNCMIIKGRKLISTEDIDPDLLIQEFNTNSISIYDELLIKGNYYIPPGRFLGEFVSYPFKSEYTVPSIKESINRLDLTSSISIEAVNSISDSNISIFTANMFKDSDDNYFIMNSYNLYSEAKIIEQLFMDLSNDLLKINSIDELY